MEMADILFVLICMANREDIDLQIGVRSDDGEGGVADRDRWEKKRKE